MKKQIIAIALFLTVLALLFGGCALLDDAAKLTEYDFGDDKVPSVNAVIGEQRKVTGINVGTENAMQYKQYTYQTSSMIEDLAAYSVYLQEKGWLVTKDYNLNDGKGEMQLGIESADEGKILIVSVAFEPTQYAIKVSKLTGTLDRY
ncbi:MAG: hypothetical protein FWD23_14940 [Oscillospiraceae bacterium]|nr:hypothetical protein [Oscillospiraceae bacterium]